jgi:hypothetical protein
MDDVQLDKSIAITVIGFGIVPDVPELPLVPELPDVPELPELPDVPEVPELPDVPALPELPLATEKDHAEYCPEPTTESTLIDNVLPE